MKTLLPSLREKKRYIVFEVISNKEFSFDMVKENINKAMLRFLGELETAKAGVQIMPDWKKMRGILRVNNKYTDKVRSSLMLIDNINNNKVMIHTRGVSGILNKARNKFM